MSPGLKKTLLGLSGASALTLASVIVPELEGVRYAPYYDIAGVLTVCYGHTGKDIVRGKQYTPEECLAMLNKDLQPFAQAVERAVTVPADEYQKAALITFSYNVGISAFQHSALLHELNAGRFEQACEGLKKWTWAGGKQWKGLMNRREVEYEVCRWKRNVS
ncbi:lysozyme [Enterobacteriaceae bacterium H20N1]|uniref:Lysozyme n=2 Tax=Dryocola boscaweniae TaxID=2925397 RepID=A0A9X2W5Z9_9ENTR|nr:lysozyme [Dryocola boscaweniae]MCT4716777.1 lysozyme [Dryocola boscaweniae]MCT4718560.1 lysozyme [Dryocola boscaweniae]